MYLASLYAENFRIFGPAPGQEGDTDSRLRMDFGPATNVLVGENGSGKTAVIDAVRLCLQTTAGDYYRITADDFHIRDGHRADSFTLTCGFKDLTPQEQAVFLELLSTEEDGSSSLNVTVRAQLIDSLHSSRVSIVTRIGPDGQGPTLDGTARELLKDPQVREDARPHAVRAGSCGSDQPTREGDQLTQISPSTQIPDGEVAAGAEFDGDAPEDPEDDASDVPEVLDVPEVVEVSDPVPPAAVEAGGGAADVPVPAVLVPVVFVPAEGVDTAGCAAALGSVCGVAAG